jgi:class 3 adenylate cyclase/mannose-6-phosphate isomerase-like protein (cupin superfamily)
MLRPEPRATYDGHMARLQRQRFEESDDVRVLEHGTIAMVELGDHIVAHMALKPGWRWSQDLKPIVGTQSCQSHHLAFALSGRLRVQMTDGIEMEVGPGEVYEIPPGHDAWVVGDEPFITVDFEAMRAFAQPQSEAGARRSLQTVLITDIVNSTGRAVELGPARWTEVVSRHNEIAERIVDRHGGRLVKTTGDGVIGLFDSAERAIKAAVAIGRNVAELQLQTRAAVHVGEVEISTGDVRGVTVHATSRIMDLAGPGEVVVSSTVRELAEGTGLEFEDIGLHKLRGMPGQRQLYRLVRPPT